MNYILSTYNFYPIHRGGTEVYTLNLAHYLMSKGHQVLIIAALDKANLQGNNVIHDSSIMVAVEYKYDGLRVVGVEIKDQDRESIYGNYKPNWEPEFQQLLFKLGFTAPDRLIMNGLSIVSGRSLLSAIRKLNSLSLIQVVVHTPFICAKADLINGFTGLRCEERISPETCSCCILRSSLKGSDAFVMWVEKLNNVILSKISDRTVFQMRDLVSTKIKGLKWLDDHVTSWVAFSDEMREYLCKQDFITPGKTSTIRHGIDTGIFFEQGMREPKPVKFLYAGRFEEIKGVMILARAWSKLPFDAGKVLYMVGNWHNTLTGKLVREILNGRQDVRWIKDISQLDLAALYREVHCSIIPSKWVETGPMVFHEAIACGCSVISSDIGGQGELVNFYRGQAIGFKSGDVTDLAEKIRTFIPVTDKKPGSKKPISSDVHFSELINVLNKPQL